MPTTSITAPMTPNTQQQVSAKLSPAPRRLAIALPAPLNTSANVPSVGSACSGSSLSLKNLAWRAGGMGRTSFGRARKMPNVNPRGHTGSREGV